MPRILFVNHSADTISGAEMSLTANIRSMPEGFEVSVITPKGKVAEFLREKTSANIVVLPLKPIKKSAVWNIFRNRKIIGKEILSRNPDIVHANSTKARMITPSKACRKLVWQIRDMQPIPRIVKHFLYRGSDKIAVISKAIEKYYDFQFSKRVCYLPPAIDFDSENYRKKEETADFTIGFIGQYVAWKNHKKFIETIKSLPGNFKGLMAGQVAEGNKKYYQNIAELAESTGRIELVPFTFDAEKDIFSKISCLMVCSHNEPFGRVIIEAFSAKIPVIAASGGGVNELITDRENGLLLKYNLPAAFKKAVETLADDPILYKTITRNAREFAMNNFTLEKQKERLKTLYDSLLDQ